MSLDDLKLLYVLSCVVLGLTILSPVLGIMIRLPYGESFSELWILGADNGAEGYPVTVSADQPYGVDVGVVNHLGKTQYYLLYLKLRNQTDSFPDAAEGSPSMLTPVSEYRVFLGDGRTWEKEFQLSLEGVSFDDECRVSTLAVDGQSFGVDKVAAWDDENRGYYLQLLFELWIYDADYESFAFHEQFVWIWLNVTAS